MEHVIVANFKVESEAYQAFSQLKQDPVDNTCKIAQVVLVKNQDGRYRTSDQFDTGLVTGDDFTKGSLIGLCIGILGGPIGMLMGWGVGAMTGSLLDASDAVSSSSLLEQVMNKIASNETALVALVQETDEMMFNAKLQGFQVEITRYDAAEVAEEVEHARRMEQELQKKARDDLREQKNAERKTKIEEKREKLRERFSKLKQEL